MRKVLLILEGEIAKEFLLTLMDKHLDKNCYIFVSQDSNLIANLIAEPLLEGHEVYNFDACSVRKLKEVLTNEITDAYIITDHSEDRWGIYQTIRQYNKNIQIVVLGAMDTIEEDLHLTCIDEKAVLSSKLFEKFPNIPRTAKYIGLGEGEIMQISVPFGSPYAYRNISTIKQKKWKIVAIYRNNELILPKYSSVIYPNDSLLLVGNPTTLWEIYYRIKEEVGQFPTPFGRDVVLFLDMSMQDEARFKECIAQSLWIFKKFKNKRLHLVIYNANSITLLHELKESKKFNSENINLHIEFYEKSFKKILQQHRDSKNIGLVLVDFTLFNKYKKELFESGIPLLKFGKIALSQITHSAVIIPKVTEEAEKISSVVYDFSTQAGFKIKLYDFDPDGHYHKQAVEYYQHIAKVFEKKFTLLQSNSLNPIFWLKEQKDVIQILPLKKEVMKKSLWRSLMEVENLSARLDKVPQLYIPLSV